MAAGKVWDPGTSAFVDVTSAGSIFDVAVDSVAPEDLSRILLTRENFALSSGGIHELDLSTFTVEEQVGTDLTVNQSVGNPAVHRLRVNTRGVYAVSMFCWIELTGGVDLLMGVFNNTWDIAGQDDATPFVKFVDGDPNDWETQYNWTCYIGDDQEGRIEEDWPHENQTLLYAVTDDASPYTVIEFEIRAQRVA